MAGIAQIKVDTARLKSTATAFGEKGTQIGTLTSQMTTKIQEMSNAVWQGEAATAYINQFNELQDDMNKMVKMVDEHVEKLNQIASTYETTEDENIQTAGQLSKDVVV